VARLCKQGNRKGDYSGVQKGRGGRIMSRPIEMMKWNCERLPVDSKYNMADDYSEQPEVERDVRA
jgi:hypothetical protein